MIPKNKRGISIMIGYVLLITTSIIISAVVYQWAKTYVPAEAIECPEGISVFLKEVKYDCSTNELNITLKNNGRFNIAGYLIHATNSTSQTLASIDLSPYTLLGEGKGGAVLLTTLSNSMKPNIELKNVFNLSNTNLGQIYSIEIVPIRFQNKKRVNCGTDERIKEKLICITSCVPDPNPCGSWVCGSVLDSCGNSVDCGTCGVGLSCDVSGQCYDPFTCSPAPDPSFSGVCGTQECNVATNGTCGDISCGTCNTGIGEYCDATNQCIVPICGNGINETGEECDDGDTTNQNDDCIIDLGSGYECVNAECGDGYIWNDGTGTETCDDGNVVNNDGCSSGCLIESNWICVGEPSVCAPESGINSCADYCTLFSGYTAGGCVQNENQCAGLVPPGTYIGDITGANETLGNSFCTTGNADTCCCQP